MKKVNVGKESFYFYRNDTKAPTIHRCMPSDIKGYVKVLHNGGTLFVTTQSAVSMFKKIEYGTVVVV